MHQPAEWASVSANRSVLGAETVNQALWATSTSTCPEACGSEDPERIPEQVPQALP